MSPDIKGAPTEGYDLEGKAREGEIRIFQKKSGRVGLCVNEFVELILCVFFSPHLCCVTLRVKKIVLFLKKPGVR